MHGFTAAMWNDSTRNLLDNGHAKGKQITVDTALDGVAALGVPLHPGSGAVAPELSAKELAELEAKYDEGGVGRPHPARMAQVLRLVALLFAAYHYLTAGFGLPVDYWHMGWYLTSLFILIYASYPVWSSRKSLQVNVPPWRRPGNVPLFDWLLMALGIASALWLGLASRRVEWLGVPGQALRRSRHWHSWVCRPWPRICSCFTTARSPRSHRQCVLQPMRRRPPLSRRRGLCFRWMHPRSQGSAIMSDASMPAGLACHG